MKTLLRLFLRLRLGNAQRTEQALWDQWMDGHQLATWRKLVVQSSRVRVMQDRLGIVSKEALPWA